MSVVYEIVMQWVSAFVLTRLYYLFFLVAVAVVATAPLVTIGVSGAVETTYLYLY